MMQTEVTRISIQRIVDRVELQSCWWASLHSGGSPFLLLYHFSSFGCRGPVPTSISVVLEAS
ncbi:hypothetical protein MTR67_048080 [Solanum verrucosum]|uniref:Uncharacterized protein n=1 Tax=Solanum verrucosum TaxID=315347 RepID=A0AAF0ZZ80_SOLVR|nr:hypothetical protein MTR67_048080 [Solanum verrucosum]